MRQGFLALVTLGIIGLSSPALAEEVAPSTPMPDEAKMEEMMKLGMPGENHAVLNDLIGTWDYTVTYKMAKDAPEQTSTGKTTNEWVLDGRFVKQNVSGTMDMGGQSMPFNGMGLIGHDNMTGEYQSVWIDNISTAMMISSESSYDAETKTITESGTYSCVMKGKDTPFKSEMKIIDADNHTYTMYTPDEKGEMFKGMEITYSRAQE